MNYKQLCLLLINGFILGIYLLFSYQPSQAQTPVTPTAQPVQEASDDEGSSTLPTPPPPLTPTTALTPETTLPSISPTLTPVAVASDQETLRLSLAELGYEDVTISGPLGETEFTLRLPSYWEIGPGSSLTLHYAPSRGLSNSIESFELQAIFDGKVIQRGILNNFDEQTLTIPLPEIPAGHREAHDLEILWRSQGDCEDQFFGLLNIFSDSFFTLNYQVRPPVLDLAYYPSPIYEPTFFTQTAYLVLPDQIAQRPLEGVLSLAAKLGQLTGNRLGLTTTTASTLDPENLPDEHLIIVGTPENNPLLSYLNDTLSLPASFQPRRLQLASLGSDRIVPNTLLTHTVYITNDESVAAANLGLNLQLPPAVQRVGCEPGCQRINNTLLWDIGTLQPGDASAVTLSLAYPFTDTAELVNLSFELVQSQTLINTLTPHMGVALEGQPGLTQTTTSSPFFFTLGGQAVPETDGVIQLLPSPRQLDKAILLVTGLTDEAVYKASRGLGTQPLLLGMKGQVALVQEIISEDSSLTELSESFTFADLGYEDRLIIGTAFQEIVYRFNLPLNWNLSSGAEVNLQFSHSSLLDPSRSSITLLFNNTPIASEALDQTNLMTGELRALLPSEKARSGRTNSLVVQVEAESLNPCISAGSSQIWTNIKASSSVYLPHTLREGADQFDLDFLPVPFTTDSNLSDVIFALPDSPLAVEYQAAIEVASYLGSESSGHNFQPVIALGDPDNVDLTASHLILIGRPSRNMLLQEINESLPQPFIPGTDAIQTQINRVIFRLPDDLDLGYLQFIPSHWSQKHAILAFTGTSDLGLAWTTPMVTNPEKNEQLRGNLALATNNLEIRTVDTRDLPTGGKVAAIATAIPETIIVGTTTPTPPAPTFTPEPVMALVEEDNITSAPASASNIPELPVWFPYVIGSGVALIFTILGIAYWQSRRRTRLEL